MILELKAKFEIKKKIKQGKSLLIQLESQGPSGLGDPIFRWKENCKYLFGQYFGKEHFLSNEFNISIGPIVFVLGGPTISDGEWNKIYRGNIIHILDALHKVLLEIDQNGLIVHSIPQHYHFRTILIAFLTTTIGFLLGRFIPSSNETKSPIESNYSTVRELDSLSQFKLTKENFQNAEILVSDLRNWYRGNDAMFKRTFDSVNEYYSISGRFRMGQSVEKIIEFCQDFRLRRGNTIDSFLVRLKPLGVDTDTLHIYKRLPMRIDQALKSRIISLGMDPNQLGHLRLDTL